MKMKAEDLKKEVDHYIDGIKNDLIRMGNFIFEHPEIGFQEIETVKYITSFLKEHNFSVEIGYGGLKTAFRAVFEQGKGGCHIGLLCEYDALKDLGHACAHHLQSPCIIGAAMAVRKCMGSTGKPYVLEIIGTPGEECSNGGKNIMIANGAFKELDIALMMHASDSTTTDIHSMARSEYLVTFYGKAAHSAIAPERGRSALEAAILAMNGLAFLRGHVRDDTRLNGIITEGGKITNVIPDKAVMQIELRSYDAIYLRTIVEWATKIMEGAAMMTQTTFSMEKKGGSLSKIPVRSLNKLLMDNAMYFKAPNITPPRQKTGSTDFASVMFHIPGSCIRVGFIKKGTAAHNQEWLSQGKSEAAHNALVVGAKTLAATVIDLIEDTALLEGIKKEFYIEKQRLTTQENR